MRIIARVIAWLSLAAQIAARIRVRSAALDPSVFAYAGKMAGAASASLLGTAGAGAALLGLLCRDGATLVAGGIGAFLASTFVRSVAAPSSDFDAAFGAGWEKDVQPAVGPRLRPRRWTWRVPAGPRPLFQRNIPFWTVPPRRDLLCDIWQPAAGVPRSGLGVIYLHAGGWQNFDKDTGTRPFFRYLAGQGHVVMDVSYRMCQETDMAGMVGDAKRAIAWFRAHAGLYGVDPWRIVLSGASAGGQLALLAAYTPCHSDLDPADVRPADTSVRGVVSYYAPVDMLRYGARMVRPDWPILIRLGRIAGMVQRRSYLCWPDVERRLYGALASEAPDIAARFSPITYAGSGCPPTLLVHGDHDRVVLVEHSRRLHAVLRGAGVPAAYLELPWIDHAFDLALLRLSPPAQAALYDVERFLALMAGPREFPHV